MGRIRYFAGVWAVSGLWLAVAPAARGQPRAHAIDAEAATVRFTVRHMGVLKVQGRFDGVTGSLMYDGRDPATLTATVTVGAESVDTGNRMRDRSLRSDTFLDAETYPTIIFSSAHVAADSSGYTVTGNLSLHGVTKEISFPFTFASGTDSTRVDASFVLNRRDFALTFGPAMDTLVGDEIRVEVALVALAGQGALPR